MQVVGRLAMGGQVEQIDSILAHAWLVRMGSWQVAAVVCFWENTLTQWHGTDDLQKQLPKFEQKQESS